MTRNAVPPMRDRKPLLMIALGGLVVLVSTIALSSGATGVPLARVLSIITEEASVPSADALIILQVRLPRLLLGLLIGAALACSGALMQGPFRNPLADPGLVGVSAGAALAAAATIVV